MQGGAPKPGSQEFWTQILRPEREVRGPGRQNPGRTHCRAHPRKSLTPPETPLWKWVPWTRALAHGWHNERPELTSELPAETPLGGRHRGAAKGWQGRWLTVLVQSEALVPSRSFAPTLRGRRSYPPTWNTDASVILHHLTSSRSSSGWDC